MNTFYLIHFEDVLLKKFEELTPINNHIPNDVDIDHEIQLLSEYLDVLEEEARIELKSCFIHTMKCTIQNENCEIPMDIVSQLITFDEEVIITQESGMNYLHLSYLDYKIPIFYFEPKESTASFVLLKKEGKTIALSVGNLIEVTNTLIYSFYKNWKHEFPYELERIQSLWNDSFVYAIFVEDTFNASVRHQMVGIFNDFSKAEAALNHLAPNFQAKIIKTKMNELHFNSIYQSLFK